MATWQADVFVNSNVGRIKTQVDAATHQGAKEQIYAKHGDVQAIYNLREVGNSWFSNSSSSNDSDSLGSLMAILLLCGVGLAIIYWYITIPLAILGYFIWKKWED